MNGNLPGGWGSASRTLNRVPYNPYGGGNQSTQMMNTAGMGETAPATVMNDLAYDDSVPETLKNTTYVPGFLRTQIGKTVRVEFYIGTSMTDRVGVLVEVGSSYILLREFSGSATIMCDLFAIKFVTIVDENSGAMIVG